MFAILSEGYSFGFEEAEIPKMSPSTHFFGTFTPLEEQFQIYNLLG